MVVLVGYAERDAQVVGADEYGVNAADGEDVVEVLDGGNALYADDADAVSVPGFEVFLGSLRGELAGFDHLADHRAFERSPLGGGHHILDLLDGFAVRGQYAVRARVEGHGDVMGVGYRDSDDGNDAAEAEGGDEVRHFGAPARGVFAVHYHVVESEAGHGGGPAGVAAHAEHGAVNYAAGVDFLFEFVSVHDSS